MTNANVTAEFKKAMRQFPATVSIVTCADGDDWAGMTVTAVSSLSLEPPALLVCVNRTSSIFPLLSRTDTFCINVLETAQQVVASHFAGRSRQGRSRFAHGRWRVDGDHAPILDGAAASIVCRRAGIQSFGTHAIVIGAVGSVIVNEGAAPALYYQGGYGNFMPDNSGEICLKKAC